MAVVSTNCATGPAEIITGYHNGLLVPVNDGETLGEAILTLLKDSDLRGKLVRNAQGRTLDFTIRPIARMYERLFCETSGFKSD